MATHVLSLTDGTTTYTLTSEPYFLEEYTPGYPNLGSDGEYEPIGETITLHVGYDNTATTVAIQGDVNNLEKMLQRARKRYETGIGDKIYLQIQWANESSVWRSEVLQGEVEINADTIRAWNQAFARIRVHIIRVPYWEGPETLARLVQQYSGQGTAEQTIANHAPNDGVTFNFVEIAKTQIQGVLPTPAIIYLANTVGSSAARAHRQIYMALGKFNNPLLFTHTYEAEAATGTGSTVTDSSCSGSAFRRITATTTDSSCTWKIRMRRQDSGRTYRVLARFRGHSTVPYSYASIHLFNQNSTNRLWKGDEVLLDRTVTASSIYDLGTIPVPLAPSSTNTMTVNLTFTVRASSSSTIDLDFVQLTPIDEYRILRPASFQLTGGQVIVDNGVDELTYVDNTVNEVVAAIGVDSYYPLDAGVGNYVNLYPGEAQRIYFLRTTTAGAPISDYLNAKVYYRPRRLTL